MKVIKVEKGWVFEACIEGDRHSRRNAHRNYNFGGLGI